MKGDGITIALPSDKEDDKTLLTRGGIEVGAMAAASEYNTGDNTIFARKESKLRRKKERALRRTRKTAKKNLKLALETESDRNAMGSQTEASEVEGTMTRPTKSVVPLIQTCE